MKNDSLYLTNIDIVNKIKEEPFYIKSIDQTPELCFEAVKIQPYCILYVKKELLSFNLLKEAIKNDSKIFNVAKLNFNLTQKDYNELVDINPQILRYVDEKFIHYKMCIRAIKKDPTVYWYFPKILKLRKTISYLAIKGDIKNLRGDFPLTTFEKYLTDDVIIWLLENSSSGYYGAIYLPEKLISKKVADFICDQSENIFEFVPKESQTPYNCIKALEKNEKNKNYIKIIENAQHYSVEELKIKLNELSKTIYLMENL